jgi:hypothetical protein
VNTDRILARAAANWCAIAPRINGAPQRWSDAFRARAIDHRAIASGTAGLWRVAWPGSGPPSSLVVKRITPASGPAARWQTTTDPCDPFYWAREALAYESGFFGDERAGVRSARCYLIDRDDDGIDLYLEDVAGEPGTAWTLETYAAAAQRLGRYQGAATESPADIEWTRGPSFFDAYVARRADLYADAQELVRLPARYLEGEALRELGPSVHGLWQRRDTLLAYCAALPRTRCHNDFWSPNLFASEQPGATIAIDLAYAGLGPLGHDPANLAADAVLDFFVPAGDAQPLWDAITRGYRCGLSEGMSAGTVSAAEHVMVLTGALKFAWLIPATFQVASTDEGIARIAEQHGDPAAFFRKRCAALRFIGTLVERSLRLLDAIG